jgi:hypothetical protein
MGTSSRLVWRRLAGLEVRTMKTKFAALKVGDKFRWFRENSTKAEDFEWEKTKPILVGESGKLPANCRRVDIKSNAVQWLDDHCTVEKI